jgi:flagellar biosynthesis protein FlhG
MQRDPSPCREGPVIAVASGKGGTGKSFVATNLAIALHQSGRRVTLVDCDFGLACVHLLLGASPVRTLQHLVEGRALGSEVRTTTRFGPLLVPGASGVQKMADLDARELGRFGQGLADWAADTDVVLLDVGAGISPQSLLALLSADHVVLVTQPEIAALTDAYAVVKCLGRRPPIPPFSTVVNRVPVAGQGLATFEKLAAVAERFTGVRLHYLGEIGEEPAVTQRRLGQPPILVSHPQCATAQEILGILDRLVRVAGPLEVRSVRPEDSLAIRFRRHLVSLC